MSLDSFISAYLTVDQNYIRPFTKSTSIRNKADFFKLLSWWLRLSKSDTLGDVTKMNNNKPLIHINIGSSSYYVNADSKRSGVKIFLSNKDSNWHLIANEDGKVNKITNKSDRAPIEGFYMYKEI